MNRALKDRLEDFDDVFLCIRERSDHAYVSNWVSVYGFFNVIRERDSQPEYLMFIPELFGAFDSAAPMLQIFKYLIRGRMVSLACELRAKRPSRIVPPFHSHHLGQEMRAGLVSATRSWV